MTSWECHKCNAVMAPWVTCCHYCQPKIVKEKIVKEKIATPHQYHHVAPLKEAVETMRQEAKERIVRCSHQPPSTMWPPLHPYTLGSHEVLG